MVKVHTTDILGGEDIGNHNPFRNGRIFLYCIVIQQVKQILKRGIPGNLQTRRADIQTLQTFYHNNTGRTMRGGCKPCKFSNLYQAAQNIIQKRGL